MTHPQPPRSLNDATPEIVDQYTAMLGLPPEVGEMAKDILANGQPCMRCGDVVKGDDLNLMFAFTASSPIMPTPSPPTILCERCGYLTAAFMGIDAAKRRCYDRGWSA